jgi:hypothetical protein
LCEEDEAAKKSRYNYKTLTRNMKARHRRTV